MWTRDEKTGEPILVLMPGCYIGKDGKATRAEHDVRLNTVARSVLLEMLEKGPPEFSELEKL
jgi:hypothetical protein